MEFSAASQRHDLSTICRLDLHSVFRNRGWEYGTSGFRRHRSNTYCFVCKMNSEMKGPEENIRINQHVDTKNCYQPRHQSQLHQLWDFCDVLKYFCMMLSEFVSSFGSHNPSSLFKFPHLISLKAQPSLTMFRSGQRKKVRIRL